MTDDRKLGVCPECEDELTVFDTTQERPIQMVELICDACDLNVTMALCWYPSGGRYVGVTTALPEESCGRECSADAVVRSQDVATAVTERTCWDHTPSHFLAACTEVGLKPRP